MCGISGIYHFDSDRIVESGLLKAMTDAIEHRGPDGSGYYQDARVGLGHRRLSIIDLEEGGQPIFNEDDSIVIVFNGEIYNYKELREELVNAGHQFKTHSDTEVIVHLYEQKGVDCVQDLNGMFAFAIWDKHKERLFVARDRLGEKPFYYQASDGRLIFSSELKALEVHPDLNKDIDLDALDDFLSYGYIPAPRSIYQGVSKLPPAHYMIVENGRVTTQRYWCTEIQEPSVVLSDQEYVEGLEKLLLDSVKLRLRSDVPVGAFLSGGIDSSLMVALCAQQSSTPISTYSLGFHEKDFDELQYAKQVADQYGTQHHEILLENIDLTMFPDIVSHFDEPFGDPSAIPTYYVTQKASEHVKVCVSGDAGDEFFCGYERYISEALEDSFDTVPKPLREGLFRMVDNLTPESFFAKGRLRRAACSDHIRWQRKIGGFDNKERHQLYNPMMRERLDQGAWLFERFFAAPALKRANQEMLADQYTYLPDDILVKVDRTSMWHGLEVRVPFLDHRIAEYANAMPFGMKNHGGIQKYAIKEILKHLVPEDIITRPKAGFGLPLTHWIKDQYYDYSRDLLLAKDSHIAQYYNQDYIAKIIEMNRSGKRDMSKRIWLLMWLEQWFRSRAK